MPERAKKSALSVHGEIARGPYGRQPHIAGEYGIVRRKLAHHASHLLRVDQAPPRTSLREIIKPLARLAVVPPRDVEVRGVGLLLETRKERFDRGGHIADQAELDRRPAPEVLRPYVELGDAHAAFRIKLAVGEVGAEHEQRIAVAHGVVAGTEADQARHADVVRVVP